MTDDEQNQRFLDAISFHKSLDKKWDKESPNDSWHDFLAEYYNKMEVNKNGKTI